MAFRAPKSTTSWRMIVSIMLLSISAFAQRDSVQNQIRVVARSSMDSIVLRWAPLNFEAWVMGIRNGYTVERFTLVRDNKIVTPAERTLLTPDNLKPWPEPDWEKLVLENKYAAIAAQALYGSEFELSMEGADVFQIVNKVQENEMRFSFGLYAADLSVPVSIAMGLRLSDTNIKKNEKYLYRIISVHQSDTIKGSIFIGPQVYELPPPVDFSADFNGSTVALKWDQSYHRGIYTAYVVERSEDGGNFEAISDDALVTLSPEDKPESRYQYATDSLPEFGKEYSYRVRGLTPFGELGPPSESIGGSRSVSVQQVPYILKDETPDNEVIDLTWEFPSNLENGLKGFDLRRSISPKSQPVAVNKEMIPPSVRTYRDVTPEKNNYYQVVAITLSSEELKSPMRLSQLVDSIPPPIPVGLQGKINENGLASISWEPNPDTDIYGYRIYRGNNRREEFSQITIEPVPNPNFEDTVNLKTLDRFIYYQVMAIDKSQNHSALSEILELRLPDKVPPVAPVFLPVTSAKEEVVLSWLPSSSDDVIRYDIYSQQPGSEQWRKIGSIEHSRDSVLTHSLSDLPEGVRMSFTLVAVDESGLESPPATPIVASRLISAVKPPVRVSEPEIDRELKLIRLKWSYEEGSVSKYQIYRAKEGEPTKLYTTVTGLSKDFVDRQLVMNSVYTYQIVALFTSGSRSEFSREIIINY